KERSGSVIRATMTRLVRSAWHISGSAIAGCCFSCHGRPSGSMVQPIRLQAPRSKHNNRVMLNGFRGLRREPLHLSNSRHNCDSEPELRAESMTLNGAVDPRGGGNLRLGLQP